MPLVFQNLYYPKLGQYSEVLQDILKLKDDFSELKSTNISSSIAMPPLMSGRHIAVNGVFQTPEEVEDFWDNVSPKLTKSIAEIHSKCTDMKRNLLLINEMPEGAPDNPKFIARRIFIAKRGKRDSLLEYLKEGRANQENKPLVMIPLGGDTDVIRMSLYFASLSNVVNAYERTIGPDNSGVRAKIADLTEKSYISLHRVISRAQN